MRKDPFYRRLLVLVALLVAALAVSLQLNPPFFWFFAVMLVGATSVGTNAVIRAHPRIHLRSLSYSLTFSILPTLLVLGAMLFLRLVVETQWIVLGLAGCGVLLAVVVLAEYRTVDLRDGYFGVARFALNLATYLAAFTLFAAIYNARVRSLQSATAVLLVGTLLASELFRESEATSGRTWLYALLVGLLLGEVTWGLNWWPLSGLAGGVFLLVAFYAVTGVIQNFLANRLNRGAVFEFGVVTVVGLAFLFSSSLWLR